ncbi:MAG: orotate phosphoribosyltransferase [Candidatus Eremiobacteraeota bacterium]|nr:orotate phosphoribosyltransferase [Candidatus Eremiobacteraeota bacterium]
MSVDGHNSLSQSDVVALLQSRGALTTGHFVLSSGRHSDRFIQKFRIFEDPRTADAVCGALAELLRPYDARVVVSAAVGGILPGYIVARALGVRDIFTEKEADKPVLRRGFTIARGERCLIVEDVMTTGRSTAEVAAVVQANGGEVCAVGTIVKRGQAALPYPLVALLDFPLPDHAPDACPLCAAGVPLQDPGSRRIGSLKG